MLFAPAAIAAMQQPESEENMPESIEVPITPMRYDIMLPLLEGRIDIPGVMLKVERGPGAMVFADNPQLREGDFGLVDLNIGYLPQVIEQDWEVVALPVISKRKSVLQFIWVRTDRGIETPKDLEGKTVVASSYTTGITTMVRGLLLERYGVDTSTMLWKVDRPDFFTGYTEARVEYWDERKNPLDRLLAGEADLMITDISDGRAWETLDASPEIKLLFPNYPDEDYAIYREMGIYPPMHLMVMSRKLDRAHPDLARRLFDAFQRAKDMSIEECLNDRAGFSVLYQRETFLEQRAKWGDPFAYGLSHDRRMFEAYMRYACEQGQTRTPLALDSVFAASTLDT